MKTISKTTAHRMLALLIIVCVMGLAAFVVTGTAVYGSGTGLNAGAAAVLDSHPEEDEEDVVTAAGAWVDEAGIIDEDDETPETETEADNQEAGVQTDGKDKAGASGEEAADEESAEDAGEIVIANVDNSVNVREDAGEDASIVGKLFKNCCGRLLEQKDGWTKIESGNLIGWVSDEYLIFGKEAEGMMEEIGCLKATVETDALRVRKEANEDAGVYKLVKTGEVLDALEESGDWVSIQVDEDTVGYVSAEFVSVEYTTEKGKTLEEIKEEERAKELAKLNMNRGAVPTSISDVTVLAALIQAEAGTQPYEGKLAVGAVVMNRVRSGGYPNTIIGVISAPGQFPPATNGTVAAIAARGPSASCMQAAEAAVAGQSNVGGALHFGRVGRAAGVVIGAHVFY